jgi:hypothetical protein
MSCEAACFEYQVTSCDDIIVRAGFPPNYDLYWIVRKTGSSNKYQVKKATENNGDLIIEKSLLPDGFFVKGRQFSIEIRNGADYMEMVAFIFGGVQYTCIQAEIVSINTQESDDSPVNVIQTLIDPITPSGPGTDYLIPLTSDDFNDSVANDGTQYDNPILDIAHDKALAIFWNDLSRYLTPAEWEHTATGIKILVPGFDSRVNTYSLYVYIIN